MRRPRFRLSMMMIAIAVIAALLGRWVNFRDRARFHRQQRTKIHVDDLEFYLALTAAQGDTTYAHLRGRAAAEPLLAFLRFHDLMDEKYEQAFRRPWFLVPYDPPAPPIPTEAYQKAFRAEFIDRFNDPRFIPNDPANKTPGNWRDKPTVAL